MLRASYAKVLLPGLLCFGLIPFVSSPRGEARLSIDKGDLYAPELAAGPDGSALLVGLAFVDGTEQVVAAAFTDGTWGSAIPVSAPGSVLDPRVVSDGDGGFHVAWAALDSGGGSDLFTRHVRGAELGPVEPIPDGPGAASQPALAIAPDGALHIAWQSLHQGRLDVWRAARGEDGWGEPIAVSDHPDSDGEPTLAFDEGGELWVAWSSWRDGAYADGNYQIYARRADGPATAVSPSTLADLAPQLVRTRVGLALVWTRHFFPTRIKDGLRTVSYDRWNDKSYQVAWLGEDRQFGEPVAVELTDDDGAATVAADFVTAVSGGRGQEVWLVFEELVNDRTLLRPYATRLCRMTPLRVAKSVPLHPRTLGPGEVAAAWAGDALLVAKTVSIEDGRDLARTLVHVETVGELPERKGMAPLPEQRKKKVVPGLMANEPGRDERTLVEHDGRTWTARFGNLHVHSDLSWDIRGSEGSPSANYRAISDLAELDFVGLSDHIENLAPREWHDVREVADLWNQPGHFVTFPGYEWTSLLYGHKNVFFPDLATADAAAAISARTDDDEQRTPDELWNLLGQRTAITIPHHVSHSIRQPTDWSFRSDEFQRLVEIFQNRGNYEYDGAEYQKPDPKTKFVKGHSVRHALDLGHRMGFIASPDHGGGFGLAGVWSDDLTRASIFEALHARRTFATTGAKLDLFMTIAGAPQGSELELDSGPIEVHTVVNATAPGLELTLVCNGKDLWTRSFEGTQATVDWTDDRPLTAPRYYYVRARQSDGHLGWASPVWLASRKDK